MNENRTKSWLYVIITAIVSAVAVFFQSILEKEYLDKEIGLFEYGAKTPSAFYFFVGVAAVLMFTAFFTLRRDALPQEIKGGSVLTSLASIACACAVVFTSMTFFMTGGAGALSLENVTAQRLETVCAVLAFPSAVYYFTVAFSLKTKTNFMTFLSFFPIVWTLVYLMSVYFDRSVLINSPVKVFEQLALITLMVYQLFETRALLGQSKPTVYFVLSNVSVLLLSAAFIPECIGFFDGTARLTGETVYTLYFAVTAVYALTRSMNFAVRSDGTEPGLKRLFASKKSPKDDIFASDED